MFLIGSQVIKTNKKGAKFKWDQSHLQHPLISQDFTSLGKSYVTTNGQKLLLDLCPQEAIEFSEVKV